MTEAMTITAVYENGVLRPVQPLNLRERQTVRIQVVTEAVSPDESENEVDELLRNLIAAGLIEPRSLTDPHPPDPVSEPERRRLAKILGCAPGKPLSEIIIEERGEW